MPNPTPALGPSSSNSLTAAATAAAATPTETPAATTQVRTSRACSSCNRQKLRCDGGKPCARCVTGGVGDACEYLPSMRGRTRKRKAPAGAAATTAPPTTATATSKQPLAAAPTPPSPPGEDRPRKRSREDGDAGTRKPGYVMWHKGSALARYGPRNSAIWGPGDEAELAESPDHHHHEMDAGMPAGMSPVSIPSVSSLRSDRGRIPGEGMTTLPLPGDLHNPLAVLAQASVSAEAAEGGLGEPLQEAQGESRERYSGRGGEYERRRPGSARALSSVDGKEEEKRRGYYAPLGRVLVDEAPHIMSLINVHEAETLFGLYHKHLHPHLPVLDLARSAPSAVARRNNLLFNAICCVAARSFNIVLWERLKEFARYEMERIPKEKNIDVVQGHLIYCTWNLIRPDNFEADMTWLRVGMASRTSIDINLHRVALIRQAREGLPSWMLRSIVRTWLMAYVLDGTLSAQLGKPSGINGESGVDIYIKILMDPPGDTDSGPSRDDVLVASLAEWTQLLSRAMDSFRTETTAEVSASAFPTPDVVKVYRKQFQQWRERAEAAILRSAHGREHDEETRMTLGMFRLYDNYSRLVVQSFGLERALQRQSITLEVDFAEYQTATVRLLEAFSADLSAPNLTRGCPDLVFTVVTYGAVSLLQSLESRYARLDPRPDKEAVLNLARDAADMLAQAAMTPDHLPASQSVFLSRLIQVRARPPRPSPPGQPEPHHEADPAPYTGADMPVTIDFGDIDFEAFGLSFAADEGRTVWPPLPFSLTYGASPTLHPADRQWNGLDYQNGTIAPQTLENGVGPTDLATWVEQHSGCALPGAALGLGVGTFGGQGGMVITQDAFWQGILNANEHPPGMV